MTTFTIYTRIHGTPPDNAERHKGEYWQALTIDEPDLFTALGLARSKGHRQLRIVRDDGAELGMELT